MSTTGNSRDKNAVLRFDDEREQWIIRYWDAKTGERKKRRLKCGRSDRQEADRQFGLFLVEQDRERKELAVVRPAPDDPTTSDPALVTIERCLAFYGESKAGTTNAALTGYHIQHLLRHWDGKTLAQIRGQTCRDYVAARLREGFTPRGAKKKRDIKDGTPRRELETLSAAIGAWHKEFTLTSRPMVTLPDRADPHPDWLTESEYGRLLRVVQGDRIISKDAAGNRTWKRVAEPLPHLERFLEIGFATGSRSTVILEAGWQRDPDRVRGHFDFGSLTFVRKGAKAPVTRKRGPACRIPDRIVERLREWKAADEEEAKRRADAGISFDDRVCHYDGVAIARIGQSFETAVDLADLRIRDIDGVDRYADPDLGKPTPHILRHTRATLLMRQGVDTAEISQFLGMSLATLLRVYGHEHPEYQKAAAAAA